MTKPREKTREEVTAEIEEGKKKIRQLENRKNVAANRTLMHCSRCVLSQVTPFSVDPL